MTRAEVMPMVRDLYSGRSTCTRNTGNVGGHLHIVLDDGNVGRNHVQWCKSEAERDGCETCRNLADALLKLSETQRARVFKEHP